MKHNGTDIAKQFQDVIRVGALISTVFYGWQWN